MNADALQDQIVRVAFLDDLVVEGETALAHIDSDIAGTGLLRRSRARALTLEQRLRLIRPKIVGLVSELISRLGMPPVLGIGGVELIGRFLRQGLDARREHEGESKTGAPPETDVFPHGICLQGGIWGAFLALATRTMTPCDILIRPARAGEAATLTALCLRAKAHWGYDPAFMAAAAPLLRIREGDIRDGGVLTARCGGPDSPASGVAVIIPLRRRGWCELSHLFIAPEKLRLGIGRALFDASIAWAAGRGATEVSILSDPYAAAFYERLGARRCGEAPSGVDPTRMLPLYAFTVGGQPAQPV